MVFQAATRGRQCGGCGRAAVGELRRLQDGGLGPPTTLSSGCSSRGFPRTAKDEEEEEEEKEKTS